MKPNKQNIINAILIELEKGIERVDCLATVGKRWQLSTRTFDRLWKEANQQYKNKQESINKELLATDIENKKQVLKTTNLDKIDRILIAEKIALGTPKKVDGTIIMPSPSDQLKALDYLEKVHGGYAPTKTESENVNKNEISIKPIDWVNSDV